MQGLTQNDQINTLRIDRRILEIAQAKDFVSAMQGGLDARIEQGGVNVSGGQRQRLAIARAVLKDPPLLILDEATSAVDNETEAAIQKSLDRIVVGRTTLMVGCSEEP